MPALTQHLFVLVILSVACGCSVSQEHELEGDLLHSDLPIFGHGGEDEWPQHFFDGASFGCTTRIRYGDWVFRESDAEGDGYEDWFRFSNYGIFHCWANTFRAFDRSNLDSADFHPTFFAYLGNTRYAETELELWVVQIGVRPGSEYVLLSRPPAEGLIERFSVLQVACPRRNVRDAGSLDTLITRYCNVTSRAELIRLARRMAKRPPLGTLSRVPEDQPPSKGD